MGSISKLLHGVSSGNEKYKISELSNLEISEKC